MNSASGNGRNDLLSKINLKNLKYWDYSNIDSAKQILNALVSNIVSDIRNKTSSPYE